MEPPTSDQTTPDKMPIVPSCPTPSSATPWILGHPSAGALSSVTVPVRLDTLAYLLNSALLRAYSAVPQTPLSCGHGASAMGHGGPPQHPGTEPWSPGYQPQLPSQSRGPNPGVLAPSPHCSNPPGPTPLPEPGTEPRSPGSQPPLPSQSWGQNPGVLAPSPLL
uniref:Uncharacterized protein n=1 Tax=Chelonoidis abingdonii TaxID=106734 RepID=A0A8C0FY58_CHEAB